MMLRPQGYGVLTGPDGNVKEADSFTCHHCQRIVFVKPRCSPSDAGGWCSICAKLICSPCLGRMSRGGGCVPWEKKMEKMEARDRFLRSAGII